MLDFLKSLDTQLFLAINGTHNAFFDFVMFWVSDKLIWTPLYIFLAWLLFRHYGKKALLLVLFAGLILVFTDQTSVYLFKNVFFRLRPCQDPSLAGMVHLVNEQCGGRFGFISSHAANSFGLAAFLSLLLGKKFRYLTVCMLLWALLLSYSRVYLGVHYPGDVIVGGIWGAAIGSAMFIISNLILKFNATQSKVDY